MGSPTLALRHLDAHYLGCHSQVVHTEVPLRELPGRPRKRPGVLCRVPRLLLPDNVETGVAPYRYEAGITGAGMVASDR